MQRPFKIFLTVVLAVFGFFQMSDDAHARQKEYRKALKKWTRQDEQYQRDDFYASVGWHATWLSTDFQQSQMAELSRTYEKNSDQKRQLNQEYKNRFGENTVFFVSFYAYDYKGSDLVQKNPLWNLYLEVDGKRYNPVKIDPVRKPTPLDIFLYPYIKPWARHYYVHFPHLTAWQTGSVKLVINGPYSHSALAW